MAAKLNPKDFAGCVQLRKARQTGLIGGHLQGE
jgi:hypothetical protein